MIRRLVTVGALYLLAASLVLGIGRELARSMALPPLFLTLLAGAAALGLPVALLVAWRYPSIGR